MARDRPMRTAPACPPTPPPCTVHITSTWSERLVNLSAWVASCFHAWFGKYCSVVRPFTVNLPLPARKNTRATDSLRRPVPMIQTLVPCSGETVVLNVPPRKSLRESYGRCSLEPERIPSEAARPVHP